ncbi:hypothetical protein Rifp1Sym_bb00020 [endosymbiont of Riftia pachyptila (vent Ph05)]|uniref:Uncharacterized protein n=1 Tax=endosymbiont of Riftia pachyptila (vent Ph05) TaxID=1048808 RepID=G2DCF0_9GAMM|nr:hypothetical protein Rifp1Sym_bb00020 [endosymbiont of Riftia pachyptila (vent Ph05)]
MAEWNIGWLCLMFWQMHKPIIKRNEFMQLPIAMAG